MVQFMRVPHGQIRGRKELSVGMEVPRNLLPIVVLLALVGGKEVDLNLLLVVILVAMVLDASNRPRRKR
jgi:hypothetical protein